MYEYCGLHLSSDVSLPELTRVGAVGPVDLTLVGTDQQLTAPQPWTHQWISRSEAVLSLANVGGRLVLRFSDDARFSFDRSTREISCSTPLDRSGRHQLLDQVMPRVLEDLGHLMIHGSAINTADGTILFMGESGHGKSTVAASFENSGIPLLTDDCMRLKACSDNSIACIPTYQSLRLWPDSARTVMDGTSSEQMSTETNKLRINLPPNPTLGPTLVAAIFALTPPGQKSSAITFSRVAPARAVALLLAQCFRLNPTDAEATKGAFQRCADVVERVPVVELSYPRDYGQLPAIRDAVLQRAADSDWS
jgi:hypothetical protein